MTTPSFFYRGGTSVGAGSGAYIACKWDTKIWDNNVFFDAAHPTRITFRSPGLYMIAGQIWWSNSSSGERWSDIGLNGVPGLYDRNNDSNRTGDRLTVDINFMYYFHALDYIELMGASSQSGLTLNGNFIYGVAITPEAIL